MKYYQGSGGWRTFRTVQVVFGCICSHDRKAVGKGILAIGNRDDFALVQT